MRSWTLIVSAGVHGLAALVLAHAPERARVAPADAPAVPIEIAMIDVPRAEPRLPEAPPAEPTAPAEAEAPKVASSTPPRSRAPRPSEPAGAPATAEPGAPSGSSGSRSLGMRSDDDPAAPELPRRGGNGPVLDLRTPSAGEAARAHGRAVGAPVVNMLRPEGLAPDDGAAAVGREVGGGRRAKDRLQFKAKIDEDGTVHFADQPAWQGEFYADPLEGVGYKAAFDLTDALMRAHGMDPYWSEKLRYLNETREERQGMALTARANRVREALAKLPVVLDAIWRDPRLEARARRRVLFELWDECVESGPPDLVRAAEEVRHTIVAFIQRRLPAGSADAFLPDEIDRLNAERASKIEFRPYTAAP